MAEATVGPDVDPLIREQLIRQRAAAEDRRESISRALRQVVVFTVLPSILYRKLYL